MSNKRRQRRAALCCAVVVISASAIYGCGGQRSGAFTHPTRVTNQFWPLQRGTEYIYTGSEYIDGRRVNHSVISIVTGLVKVIDGVRTVVIWERDFDSGRLQEGELSFQAQDDSGRVWLFGEYPEEYEAGKVTGAPDTWIAGVARAKRGLLMHAAPRASTPSYLQGWAPTVGFADHAKVYRTGERNCVPVGCYADVLQTVEWSPDDPHARQLKYYAPGLGNIRVGFAGDPQREVLVLRDVKHLGTPALAAVDTQALEIDRRGYRVNKRVYGSTPPASTAPKN
jgi:hypothetical protein